MEKTERLEQASAAISGLLARKKEIPGELDTALAESASALHDLHPHLAFQFGKDARGHLRVQVSPADKTLVAKLSQRPE